MRLPKRWRKQSPVRPEKKVSGERISSNFMDRNLQFGIYTLKIRAQNLEIET